MNAKTSKAYRPSRRVQVAIWAVLVAVVATVFPLSGYASSMADLNSSEQTASAQAAQDITLAADSGNDALVDNAPSQKIRDVYGKDAIDLLPAYRWKNAVHLPQQYSAKDYVASGGEPVMTNAAEMLFTLAGLVWGILLSILRFAMSLDIVEAASGAINAGFHRVSEALGTAGMFALVAALAVVSAATSMFKRGGVNSGAIKRVISCVLMLGLLQAFGTATAPENVGDNTNIRTPAGLALLGNRYINEAGGAIATAFGGADALTNDARKGKTGGSDTGATTCSFYIERLYSNYESLRGGSGDATITAKSLTMASFLWQRAVYDNWTLAAFGGTNNAKRIACHQMELNAGVDPYIQMAVVSDPKATATTGTTAKANLGGYSGMGVRAFYEMPERKRQETAMLSWAACDAKTIRPGWAQTHKMTDDANSNGAKPCEAWFYTPLPKDANDMANLRAGLAIGNDNALNWGDTAALKGDTLTNPACDASDAGCTKSDLRNVHSVVNAYWGHNAGQKVMSGTIALLSSGVYAWAFGAAAAGTILTQFGLLFLLMVLPWTLLMLAVPNKSGAGTGKRLLKTTVTFMAAKVMFIALLGVTMTVMTTLFDLVLGDNGIATKKALAAGTIQAVAGDTTTTQQAWSLVIPVVTIVIMNQLTKALGLKGVMSLSGAAGFATAAVGKATGGDKVSGAIRGSLGKATGKQGFDAAKQGLRRFGKAGASAGKSALQAPSDLKRRAGELKAMANGALELRKSENADLRRATSLKQIGNATGGRLSKKDARAEAMLRRDGLSHGLAEAVRSGRKSKHDAMVEMAKTATSDNPFKAGAPVQSIDKAALMARAGSYTLATMGRTAAEAAEIRTQMLGAEFASASAALRVDGRSSVVSPQAAQDAVANLQARSGNAHVVSGTSSFPPLVVPAGKLVPGSANLAYPEFQLSGPNDPQAEIKLAGLMATLSSPTVVLPPKVLEVRPGESGDEYHMRVAASAVAVGSISEKGVFHDVLAELGLPSDTDSRDAALAEIAAGRGRWADKLTALRREMSAGDVSSVDALVASKRPEMSAARAGHAKQVAASQHAVEAASRLARELSAEADKFSQLSSRKMAEKVEALAKRLSAVQGSDGEAAEAGVSREVVRALGMPEHEARQAFVTLRTHLEAQAQALLSDTLRKHDRIGRSTSPQAPAPRRIPPGEAASPMA